MIGYAIRSEDVTDRDHVRAAEVHQAIAVGVRGGSVVRS